MAISKETTAILKIARGTTEFKKVSLGTTLLWEDAVPLAIDSFSGGAQTSFGTTAGGSTTSYNHVPVGTPNRIICAVTGYRGTDRAMTYGVTYGGNSMSAIGGIIWGGTGSQGANASYIQWFELASPPSGTQAVVASWTSSGGNVSATSYMSVVTAALVGAGSTAGPTANGGTESGTALALDVSSNTGEIVLAMLVNENLSSSDSVGPWGTTNAAALGGAELVEINGGFARGALIWAPGASTVSFTGERNLSGSDYCESAIRLLPA